MQNFMNKKNTFLKILKNFTNIHKNTRKHYTSREK